MDGIQLHQSYRTTTRRQFTFIIKESKLYITFIFYYTFMLLCDQKAGFFKLGFTPFMAEQPLRGMDFQEKEAQKG